MFRNITAPTFKTKLLSVSRKTPKRPKNWENDRVLYVAPINSTFYGFKSNNKHLRQITKPPECTEKTRNLRKITDILVILCKITGNFRTSVFKVQVISGHNCKNPKTTCAEI